MANSALYDSYFGKYGGTNPCIITEFERAGDLHSIVIDYIEQSCTMVEELLNN